MKPHSSTITRRTLLKGVGVTMALPWLESLSGWGGEPPSGIPPPATPPKRFAALFMGNGISPNNWWAKGAGADMELSKSLQPLSPLRSRLNVVSGLFNKHATGVGIHPGQTGNILSGAALQKGAGAARRRQHGSGARRPFRGGNRAAEPGAGMRAADHRLPRNEFLDGLQLAHLLAGRQLAGADGGLPVAGVRQPLRQPGQPADNQHPRPRQGTGRGPQAARSAVPTRPSSTST